MIKLALIFLVMCANSFAEEGVFKGKTFIKNPLELRDPFKRKLNKKKSGNKSVTHSAGVYTNITETIDNKPLESIRIVGVVLGKERRAMAKLSGSKAGSDVFILKEGMKLGTNNAEIKAILPGGIVLVEKIRNVYDQDEYLETVLPVTSD